MKNEKEKRVQDFLDQYYMSVDQSKIHQGYVFTSPNGKLGFSGVPIPHSKYVKNLVDEYFGNDIPLEVQGVLNPRRIAAKETYLKFFMGNGGEFAA